MPGDYARDMAECVARAGRYEKAEKSNLKSDLAGEAHV